MTEPVVTWGIGITVTIAGIATLIIACLAIVPPLLAFVDWLGDRMEGTFLYRLWDRWFDFWVEI